MHRRKRMTQAFVASVLLPLATAGAPARAAFVAPVAIDGPSADILSVSDLDLSRDGQGGVVYLRSDGGVPHAYLSRFTAGHFGAPQRLDAGVDAPASQPVVAAADNGKLAIAYTSGGTLYAAVFDPQTSQWSPLQAIASGASNPSLDLSIHGAGFLTYTEAGDVRAARLERTATQFTVIGSVLDLDQAQVAGDGAGRSRVAIGADSTAIAVWGEGGHVIARRLYRTSISTAPVDLGASDIEGWNGGVADIPEVSIEDDSSFAHVAFRQQFSNGTATQARLVARRLRGSAVDPPVLVDGGTWGGAGAVAGDVTMSGKGAGGVAAVLGDGTVTSTILKDDRFAAGLPVGTGVGAVLPRMAAAETTQRMVAWLASDGAARSRFYEDRADTRTIPAPGPDTALSSPDWGAVDGASGLELAGSRLGDFAAVFVQGTGAERRLVAGTYDRPPSGFSIYTTSAWRNPTRGPVSWDEATDLWGGVTYIVTIDGREIGRTTQAAFSLPPAALIPDGIRTLRVTAVDRNGQQEQSDPQTLRLDSAPPTPTITTQLGKKTFVAKVQASDFIPAGQRASGVATVTIRAQGRVQSEPQSILRIERGRKTQKVTLVAVATDNAGNVTIVKKPVTIKKRKAS